MDHSLALSFTNFNFITLNLIFFLNFALNFLIWYGYRIYLLTKALQTFIHITCR